MGLGTDDKLILSTQNGLLSGVAASGGSSGVDFDSTTSAQLSIGNSIEASEVEFTLTSDGDPDTDVDGLTVSYLSNGMIIKIGSFSVVD